MSLPENLRRAMERKPVYADTNHHDQRAVAEHQPVSRVPLADGKPVQEADGTCYRVRIVSYAIRSRDADNVFVKHAVDSLRYAGIIPDDSPEHITLEVSQVRVKTKAEQKTVIEISR